MSLLSIPQGAPERNVNSNVTKDIMPIMANASPVLTAYKTAMKPALTAAGLIARLVAQTRTDTTRAAAPTALSTRQIVRQVRPKAVVAAMSMPGHIYIVILQVNALCVNIRNPVPLVRPALLEIYAPFRSLGHQMMISFIDVAMDSRLPVHRIVHRRGQVAGTLIVLRAINLCRPVTKLPGIL